jgi:hypothetical protein
MASTNTVKIKLVGERATEFATLCGNVTHMLLTIENQLMRTIFKSNLI